MTLEKITKLSWIYDLHRLVQSPTSLDSSGNIYQQILVHIVDGFDAKSGCLALSAADRENLAIVAGIDLPPDIVGKCVEMGMGVLGWVAKENAALLLNGCISNDTRFQKMAERNETETPHSAICWPLKIEDKVIGAISLNRPADRPNFTQADLEKGTIILNLVSLVLSNIQLQMGQQRRIEQFEETNSRLEQAQNQLLQSEKMAAIGQMAAGVAHEINNPIGFVFSNLSSLEKYVAGVFQMLDAYEQAECSLPENAPALETLRILKQKIDLQFLKDDIPSLVSESRDGLTRVKNIVQNLKDFSRVDSGDDWQFADLHKGIQSTINIAWSQLKYTAEIKREFGDIPEIECLPSQLNQVFLNILVNAGHAIGEHGVITIRTARQGEYVTVAISDTGSGIKPENMKRIFDPFFTTKKVGEGTGLGLSVSYGIVQKHHGKIEVESEIGKGTTFTVSLPIRHADTEAADALILEQGNKS